MMTSAKGTAAGNTAFPHAAQSTTAQRRTRRRTEGGFIITLEFLIISAIMLIVIVLAIILIRQFLEALAQARVLRSVIVIDSTNSVVGPAISFDAGERPLILLSSDDIDGRALLGVSVDRFISYQDVFYDTDGCVGDGGVYLQSPQLIATTVSGLNNLQGASLAIGRLGGQSNWLFHGAAPVLAPVNIRSSWSSRTNSCDNSVRPNTPNLVTAAAVRNLAADFPPPYSVASPSMMAASRRAYE